jgi:hypothetical protein
VPYVLRCGANSLFYTALLLIASCVIFRKRDLQ